MFNPYIAVPMLTHTDTDTYTATVKLRSITNHKSIAIRLRGRPSDRLSNDVQSGFVAVENCKMLVGQKIELIILGVVAQSLQDIQAFAAKENAGLSMVEWNLWKRMDVNLGYLVDLIEPMVLKLYIFEAFEEPLKFEMVNAVYHHKAKQLSYIQNYSVATCNAQTKLSENGVEWFNVKAKWMLVSMELEDQESGMRVD